ncbi:MAG: enoyl-CoA hydratase/isomerase family protein [Alphaproteobacteria bacterium]|nr:enoyl-CoA hydratase/isomerase family protein [Alphaproteobacteria bacterium]
MEYRHIKVDRGGEIATVTFNRPEVANALNARHLQEIEHAALSFRDDAEARVVIFEGAGKHFTSGADLSERQPADDRLVVQRQKRRIGQRCIQALLDMDQITIAAWTGAAMGGGACIASALDFRVGAEDCFMSFPEILIGVPLMWQSLPICVHLMGPARAKRIVISGEHVRGPTLLEWGVLDEMVATGAVSDTAMEWAKRYAAQPPIAAQMIKRSVNAISGALDRSIMHMDFDQHLLASGTEDAAIAVASYRGDAPRVFKGN